MTTTPECHHDRRGPRPAVAAVLVGPLAVVGGVAALVVVVLGFAVAGGAAPTAPDRWAQSVVAGWWPSPGDTAYLIDFLGDPRSVAAAAVVLAVGCALLGRRRLAVVALAAPVFSGLITTLGKPLVQRTIHGEDNMAYPSGHVGAIATLAAVAMLLVVDLVATGRVVRVVVFVAGTVAIASAMAVDQVAIEAHYPLDAVGGLCVAFAVVTGLAIAVDRGTEAARVRLLRR